MEFGSAWRRSRRHQQRPTSALLPLPPKPTGYYHSASTATKPDGRHMFDKMSPQGYRSKARWDERINILHVAISGQPPSHCQEFYVSVSISIARQPLSTILGSHATYSLLSQCS